MAQTDNIANKHIPVRPSTWRAMHKLRTPGQTFDEMIREQIPAVKLLAEQEVTAPTAPGGAGGA